VKDTGESTVGDVLRADAIKFQALDDVLNSTEITDNKIPNEYKLFQNYPNPFNPSTNIQFFIPELSITKISIFNSLGQKIETLVDNELETGIHSISWKAGHRSSGIYYIRLECHSVAFNKYYSETVKSILLK
jgi:hypothetical protein